MKAVNLIPDDQRATASTAATSSKRVSGDAYGAYAVLGLLAIAVIAAALYVLAGNDVRDKQAERARVEQQATMVEQQSASLQAFADFKALADNRAQTVRGLADARFPWPRTLDDISRALPQDVFINSLDAATSAGATGSGLRTAIAAPSIELNGCTKDQLAVAQLMSRLRGIRGVTRVTLVKSEKPMTSSATTAPVPSEDGSGDGVTTQPCPKGSPPAFDVIVFFERAAATTATATNPTAVTGPTGATGATTGPTGSTGATTPASTTTAP